MRKVYSPPSPEWLLSFLLGFEQSVSKVKNKSSEVEEYIDIEPSVHFKRTRFAGAADRVTVEDNPDVSPEHRSICIVGGRGIEVTALPSKA